MSWNDPRVLYLLSGRYADGQHASQIRELIFKWYVRLVQGKQSFEVAK
jgi:hypothetical protein